MDENRVKQVGWIVLAMACSLSCSVGALVALVVSNWR